MFKKLKINFILIFFMTAPHLSPAQNITGEYRLRGNHEMVAAFKFNEDSSFEFYFIYGAVDRMSSGTYKVENGKVILKANKLPGKDFTVKEQKNFGPGTTVKITDKNSALQQRVLCIFKKGSEQQEAYSDSKGLAHSTLTNCDTVMVMHLLFPDVPTTIKSGNDDKFNYFEVALNPSLAELSFQGFSLAIEGDTLTGSLPYIFESEKSTFTKR